jgi:hypothetical protein
VADALTALDRRLARLEHRLEDVEDLVAVALHPDRVDALAARLDDLAAGAATREELAEVRLRTARVAGELGRLGDDVRRQVDHVVAEHLAVAVGPPSSNGS